MPDFLLVDVSPRRGTTCAACGDETPVECGLPVDDAGDFVANDYTGEWAGVPACRRCYDFHAAHGPAALEAMVEELHRARAAAPEVPRG